MAQFKYDFNPAKTEDYRKTGLSADRFSQWTKDHMYRTSYGNHWTNEPQPLKNVTYAGYGGFIPGIISENKYAKGYSPITRECFNKNKLGENLGKLATTGFNFKKTDFIDQSLAGSSHKYGMSSIQKHHPNWHVDKWESTTQHGFQHPKQLVNPTFRETEKSLQTQNKKTKESGFQQNHTYFDGTGWVPDKILHSDLQRTEYRLRYNQDVPFHRDPQIFRIRQLKKPQNNYKHT